MVISSSSSLGAEAAAAAIIASASIFSVFLNININFKDLNSSSCLSETTRATSFIRERDSPDPVQSINQFFKITIQLIIIINYKNGERKREKYREE